MFRRLRSIPETVTVTIDGVAVPAAPGETVAAVLVRTAPYHARLTPVSGEARAPYCLMGVCFDCLAVVDERPTQRTCMTVVQDGMRVLRQRGPRDLSDEPEL